MTNKIFLFLFLFLLIPLAFAQTQTSLGVYEKGKCVELIQLCGDCTFNQLTSLVYPNTTKVNLDVMMTKRGTEYNYTYCFPNLTGEYLVNGVGDLGGTNTSWAYILTLTPNGDLPTTAKINLQLGLIFILSVFLIFSIIGFFKVDHYITKFVFFWISYLLAIALVFMSWNGSANLLTSAPFVEGFFRIIFFVLIIAMFPLVLMSIVWIAYIHTVTDEIKDMMERGMTSEEAWDRSYNKRGGWLKW